MKISVVNKLLRGYTRLFVLWVVLGGIGAYCKPDLFIPFKKHMELFFGLTMFGIGAVLHKNDFENIFKNIWVVVIGVCAQFTIMPLSAFLLSRAFHLSREFTLGLILTGSAPGAMASNVLSFLAGADVAYSVSLTTASTLLSPILTPFLTFMLARAVLDVPFGAMVLSVIKMVVLPLVLGFWIRSRFHRSVDKISKIFPVISITFIVFICSLVIALNKTYLLKMNASILFVVMLLNLVGLSLGYGVGKIARFDILKRRALSIEIGMQNAGLGSVLALKHFSERTALPAVLFVFVCIFSASLLVQLWHRENNRGNFA